MNQRRMMRGFRKEMLLLQAEQHRMVLQQGLRTLSLPLPAAVGQTDGAASPWPELLGSVLGAVLPARWGRWFNLALSAWRISRRLAALRQADKAG